MSENVSGKAPFAWTEAKETAAVLLAEDELTDRQIAEEVGVADRTLWRWKEHPEFAARVKEHADRIGETALRYAVGRKAARLAAYNERWLALRRVVAGQLNPPEGPAAAGRPAPPPPEPDPALLKALLDLEKQAAVEAGQWTKQHEVRGAVASVSVIPEISELLKMPAEELLRLHLETLGLPGPGDRG
jgi:hypothetical protein